MSSVAPGQKDQGDHRAQLGLTGMTEKVTGARAPRLRRGKMPAGHVDSSEKR